MQFAYDWRMTGTKAKIEEELSNVEGKPFVLDGPGTYLTATDTVLVVPCVSSKEINPRTLWHQRWPDDTVYEVMVWNQPTQNLVLSYLATAPTRMDERV